LKKGQKEQLPLPTVLLVEDNKQARKLMKKYFEKAIQRKDLACRILEAANGQEALQIMSLETPELILCDIGMPVMNGFQVLDEFNRIHKQHSPFCFFVFLTGDADERKRAYQKGVMGFLAKEEINYFTLTLQIRAWLRLAILERKEGKQKV